MEHEEWRMGYEEWRMGYEEWRMEKRSMNSENNNKITSFTDLNAWKYAHNLVLEIYKITKIFPNEEKFALIDQMRRAAISIVSNIAEGFGRQSLKEKVQFYAMAQGSTTELQSQLLIARDLGYITSDVFSRLENLTITVHKLITGLILSTKNRIRIIKP